MSKTLVALLATIAFAGLSLEASAQERKCPKGSVWDADRGKCIIPRGSH
jgi:hypothetical protein